MQYLSGDAHTAAEAYMHNAAAHARNALCERAKCGAVVVKEGAVIGAGYNGPPRDDTRARKCSGTFHPEAKPKSDITCCVHAEWRAITEALAQNAEQVAGARLYFVRVDDSGTAQYSGEPYCTVCSRLALDSGIAEFTLWHQGGICVYDCSEYNDRSYAYFT